MDFSFSSAGLGVACRNWPRDIPQSLGPFLGAPRCDWNVEFQTGLSEIRVHAPAHLVEVSDLDISRGLLAGLCLAACERTDLIALHAAACAVGDRCLLFLAPPEGGKSTLSTLMAHATLLSDELVIVRRAAGSAWAYGTPVRSACPREPTPGPFKVAAFVFLHKAEEDRLEPLGRAEAFQKLFAQMWATPGLAAPVALSRASRVVGNVPSYEFSFRKDAGCVHLLDELIENSQ